MTDEPMADVPGVACDNPVDGAELVAHLDWYDGEILVLERTPAGLWLRVWSDKDERTHRWLIVKTTRERIDAMGDGRITLAGMFRDPADGRLIVLDGHVGQTFRCVVADDPASAIDGHVGDIAHPRDEWREQPRWPS